MSQKRKHNGKKRDRELSELSIANNNVYNRGKRRHIGNEVKTRLLFHFFIFIVIVVVT
jgi:hypothetical protein